MVPDGEVAWFLLDLWLLLWWLEANTCPAAAGDWDTGNISSVPIWHIIVVAFYFYWCLKFGSQEKSWPGLLVAVWVVGHFRAPVFHDQAVLPPPVASSCSLHPRNHCLGVRFFQKSPTAHAEVS